MHKWKGSYRIHERLLLSYYSRHQPDARKSWLSDPLAPWRTYWRTLGVLLLVFNGVAGSAAAWDSRNAASSPAFISPGS